MSADMLGGSWPTRSNAAALCKACCRSWLLAVGCGDEARDLNDFRRAHGAEARIPPAGSEPCCHDCGLALGIGNDARELQNYHREARARAAMEQKLTQPPPPVGMNRPLRVRTHSQQALIGEARGAPGDAEMLSGISEIHPDSFDTAPSYASNPGGSAFAQYVNPYFESGSDPAVVLRTSPGTLRSRSGRSFAASDRDSPEIRRLDPSSPRSHAAPSIPADSPLPQRSPLGSRTTHTKDDTGLSGPYGRGGSVSETAAHASPAALRTPTAGRAHANTPPGTTELAVLGPTSRQGRHKRVGVAAASGSPGTGRGAAASASPGTGRGAVASEPPGTGRGAADSGRTGIGRNPAGYEQARSTTMDAIPLPVESGNVRDAGGSGPTRIGRGTAGSESAGAGRGAAVSRSAGRGRGAVASEPPGTGRGAAASGRTGIGRSSAGYEQARSTTMDAVPLPVESGNVRDAGGSGPTRIGRGTAGSESAGAGRGAAVSRSAGRGRGTAGSEPAGTGRGAAGPTPPGEGSGTAGSRPAGRGPGGAGSGYTAPTSTEDSPAQGASAKGRSNLPSRPAR